MKQKWFKTKRYGWGWTPATWQGWALVVLYVEWVIFGLMLINELFQSTYDIARMTSFHIILSSMVLCLISWLTGEKPRWRWGK